MQKREWGAESNEKLPHLFIPSKTVTLVPEFSVEDLPLDRTSTLVPAFAVKDLPLGRTLMMMMMMMIMTILSMDFTINKFFWPEYIFLIKQIFQKNIFN